MVIKIIVGRDGSEMKFYRYLTIDDGLIARKREFYNGTDDQDWAEKVFLNRVSQASVLDFIEEMRKYGDEESIWTSYERVR